MAAAGAVIPKIKGGAFLTEESQPEGVFTMEDLGEEHLAIARTADEFWAKEIQPNIEAIRHQEPGAAVKVLRKSAELGLTAISIPEKFGGMELDLASALVAEEHLGRDASYAGWHGAHTGIGTLPILYFGTEEQKQKYLPKLAKVEMVAAYALTEPQAGSDALAARTRADLSPDGRSYILNGQKMWITNGGAADLFTVFAKVGGEKFTAFLVERSFPGVSSGAEEKKMGIKGSSTTAVYFENARVPVENMLGEIGRGHIIAFNILNMGRLKLGALAVGGAKDVLAICLKYAKERKAFGSSIAAFGAIQHKLAEMAIRTYAAESIAWRVAGLIQAQLNGFSWDQPDASQAMLKAVEEYAVECSIAKVYGSEALDYVVDEGVQIHGGYGYHQDYAVERAYRDSRINRIFEGTNEINRLLVSGMLLKRAGRGQMELASATQALLRDIQSGAAFSADADEEMRLVRNAKKIGLLLFALAHEKYQTGLDAQQEILMNLADVVIQIFAMESSLLRSRKLSGGGKATISGQICAVLLRDAMSRIELSARNVIGACPEGDGLRKNMPLLRRLANYDPVDAIAFRRGIAGRSPSSATPFERNRCDYLMNVPLTPIRCLYRGVDLYGKKVGIVSGDRRYTYAQFGERCERLAAGLLSEGIRRGDRIAYLSFNNNQLLEGYYGVPLIRSIVMPLNVRLNQAELIEILNHAGARMLIFENDFARLIPAFRTACPCIERYVAIDSAVPQADFTLEELLLRGRIERPDLFSFDESESAELFYTSGSTGTPKGVMLSHRTIYLHALGVTGSVTQNDTFVELHTIPLFHANGWGRPQTATMNGAKQVMVRRFDPSHVLELIQEEQASGMSLVPVMANALLNCPALGSFDTSSLQEIHIGGAAASPELIERLEQAFHCLVMGGYGLTETCPVATSARTKGTVSYSSEEDRIRHMAMAGWPILGNEIRVVDSHMRDVQRNMETVGEIIIRGDNVMDGYYKDPEATKNVIIGGWLRTGDMAVWDDENYIHIVDRSKDIIISGGENISSIEIEKTIFAHPAVLECAVVAAPDPRWGEIPAAMVVLKPDRQLNAEELLMFLQTRLAKFKLPRIVQFIEGPLPKTGTGKILKRELREKFWEGKERRVQGI